MVGSPGSGDYGMEMDMDGMHGDMDDMEGMEGYGDEGVDMVRYDFFSLNLSHNLTFVR